MPVLSRGVVPTTFYAPAAAAAAACCCCLLLLIRVAHPWTLKGGVKPRQVVLRNALEITVEERPLALEICLHGYDNCPETRLNNGSFLPQHGPPRGTMAWYTPY